MKTTDTDPEVRRELVDTVRRFITREVVPVAFDLEHADTYPEDIVEQMKALGLFGIAIPEAYGGLGLDLLTYTEVVEELAYGWMSLSGVVNTHFIVPNDTDYRHRAHGARLETAVLSRCSVHPLVRRYLISTRRS